MNETPVIMPSESERERRIRKFMTWFFGFVVIAGGCAFVFKLYEFFMDLSSADGLRFAGVHLLTYCLVAGGFLCFLLFAFLKGHFSEIEKPKFEFLESECRYDRDAYGS